MDTYEIHHKPSLISGPWFVVVRSPQGDKLTGHHSKEAAQERIGVLKQREPAT